MATLTVAQVASTGVAQALAAAGAAGDQFANNGKTFLVVANGHVSASRTVTIASKLAGASLPPGSAASNAGGAVAAGVTKVFGPFDPASFNNASGRVEVTYSSEADLTVQALTL